MFMNLNLFRVSKFDIRAFRAVRGDSVLFAERANELVLCGLHKSRRFSEDKIFGERAGRMRSESEP